MTEIPAITDIPDPIFAVMDAGCSLCARGANWIARNDKKAQIRIIPMQSALGKSLLARHGLDPDDPATWLYVEHGHAFTALSAYARVGQRLGGIWKGLAVLRLVPRPMQDAFYYRVARNRHWLFRRTGRTTFSGPDECPFGKR